MAVVFPDIDNESVLQTRPVKLVGDTLVWFTYQVITSDGSAYSKYRFIFAGF